MNYRNIYQTEVQKRLKPVSDPQILTSKDIQSLPEPVQKYLIYVGAVGKPKVHNVRVVFNGSMNKGWKRNIIKDVRLD